MRLGFVFLRSLKNSTSLRYNCRLFGQNHPSTSLKFCSVSLSKCDFDSHNAANAGRKLSNPVGLRSSLPGHCPRRLMSTQAQPQKSASVTKIKKGQDSEVTLGQKVVRAGKDVTYTGVFLIGVAVTGVMFYAIGRELFSGQSPTGIYRKAFNKCKKNDDVYVLLGSPLKAYGETNRRGRRRFTSHTEFVRDGVHFMRMKFYIEGPSQKATVHLEAKQDENHRYQFRYIFVEPDDGLRGPIIVEDNR